MSLDQFPQQQSSVEKGPKKPNAEELLIEKIFKNDFSNYLADSRMDTNKIDDYEKILKDANTDIEKFLKSGNSVDDFINDPKNKEKILALQALINSAEEESYRKNTVSQDMFRLLQNNEIKIIEDSDSGEEVTKKLEKIKNDILKQKEKYEENFNKIMEKIYSKDLNLDNLIQNIDKNNNSEIGSLLNKYRDVLEGKKYFDEKEREEIKLRIWNDKDELRGGRRMFVKYPSYVLYNSEHTGWKGGYKENLENRMDAAKQMYLLNQIEKKIENIFNKQKDVLIIPQNKPELDDSDKYWLSKYDDIKKLINNLNDEDNRIPQLKSQLKNIKDELSKRGIESPKLLLDRENNYKNEVGEKKKGFFEKIKDKVKDKIESRGMEKALEKRTEKILQKKKERIKELKGKIQEWEAVKKDKKEDGLKNVYDGVQELIAKFRLELADLEKDLDLGHTYSDEQIERDKDYLDFISRSKDKIFDEEKKSIWEKMKSGVKILTAASLLVGGAYKMLGTKKENVLSQSSQDEKFLSQLPNDKLKEVLSNSYSLGNGSFKVFFQGADGTERNMTVSDEFLEKKGVTSGGYLEKEGKRDINDGHVDSNSGSTAPGDTPNDNSGDPGNSGSRGY